MILIVLDRSRPTREHQPAAFLVQSGTPSRAASVQPTTLWTRDHRAPPGVADRAPRLACRRLLPNHRTRVGAFASGPPRWRRADPRADSEPLPGLLGCFDPSRSSSRGRRGGTRSRGSLRSSYPGYQDRRSDDTSPRRRARFGGAPSASGPARPGASPGGRAGWPESTWLRAVSGASCPPGMSRLAALSQSPSGSHRLPVE